MRHGIGYRKFQKSAAHTRSMFRNLATSLLLHERVQTTTEKAKELRPIVEKLITLGKTDSLPARRKAYSYLKSKEVVHRLFTEVGPRFEKRKGGYTRVIRAGRRPGDCAEMAYISLVELSAPSAAQTESSAAQA